MSKREIKCAQCKQSAVEHGVGDDEIWDEPFCPACGTGLTIEGLLIEIRRNGSKERVRELGQSGAVILEYVRNTGRNDDTAEAEKFRRRIYDLGHWTRAPGVHFASQYSSYQCSWSGIV